MCQTAIGKGKNRVLVRGSHGTEWVFCPKVRSIKNDRLSIHGCRRCPSFISFVQTSVPKRQLRTAVSSRESVHDFNLTRRPITTWKATVPGSASLPNMLDVIKEKKHLVDVFEEEDNIVVLAELLGVDEKDVRIKADGSTLTITTENTAKKYLETVKLPAYIKRDTARVTFKNNILQVKLKKLSSKQ
jgi:HSP20 family molecular chaperone IbpA